MATQINLLPEVPPMGERLIAIAAERESKRLSAINRVTQCYWCTMFFERHGILCPDHDRMHTSKRDSRWGETPEDVEAILVALRGIDAAMPKIEYPEAQP